MVAFSEPDFDRVACALCGRWHYKDDCGRVGREWICAECHKLLKETAEAIRGALKDKARG